MGRRIRPADMRIDLEVMLAQCLAIADQSNLVLTGLRICCAIDALKAEENSAKASETAHLGECNSTRKQRRMAKYAGKRVAESVSRPVSNRARHGSSRLA